MSQKLFIFIIVSLCWASNALAKVELWVWQPTPNSVRLVLPRVDGESPIASYQRYVNSGNADADTRSLFKGPINIPQGNMSAFKPDPRASLTALLVANAPEDMEEKPQDMLNFLKPLSANGADVYAVPVSADLGLNAHQAEEFRQVLAHEAALVVGVGGDDIDPNLIGQSNQDGLSVSIHPTRDLSEAKLWKTVLASGNTYVVGICRSHQMLLSLLGYPLVRDLEKLLHLPSHQTGQHLLNVLGSSAYDDMFAELPEGKSNSFHHQGFYQLNPNGPVFALAVDEHGVVEATVFKNGRGVTFQFHPELSSGSIPDKFARALVQQALAIRNIAPLPLRTREFEHASGLLCRGVLH